MMLIKKKQYFSQKITFFYKNLHKNFESSYDSMAVLHGMRNEAKSSPSFVANRLAKIEQSVKVFRARNAEKQNFITQ